MRRHQARAALAAWFLAACVVAHILLAAVTQAAEAQPVAMPASQELPLLASAARRAGIRTCLPALSAISASVSRDVLRQDVLLDWDRESPDDGAFFSLLASETRDRTMLLSVNRVPERNGGCAFLVENIQADRRACNVLASDELVGYTRVPFLPTVDVYTLAERPQETVMLVRASPGCLMVWRHVQYGIGRPTRIPGTAPGYQAGEGGQ
ncbi:hypothetical protein [Luteimonas sp. gir]|uniref:hypothetical protein n=1 Tax=Luteimonas sp. gir TaxID=3127960 RepID=UPI0026B8B8D3